MAADEQANEVSAKELAEMVGVDPAELRKWLRAQGMKAEGQRKRYAFTRQRAGQLAKKFKQQAADES